MEPEGPGIRHFFRRGSEGGRRLTEPGLAVCRVVGEENRIMKAKHFVKKRLRFEELERRQVLSATSGLHAAAVQHAVQSTTSSNWSGYAIETNPGDVSKVSGTWKVPAVTGSSTAYSAYWVGIDGYSSSTVEQSGPIRMSWPMASPAITPGTRCIRAIPITLTVPRTLPVPLPRPVPLWSTRATR